MNQAHVHLLVNHFPIIIPIIAFIVVLAGFAFKSELVKRIAYGLFVLGALFTLAAMQSGEGAEEIVEEMVGVSHDVIHEHEESAETFAIFSYILGLLSALAFWSSWKKKAWSNYIGYLAIITAAVVISQAHSAGKSGGDIRHPEINQTFSMGHDEDHE